MVDDFALHYMFNINYIVDEVSTACTKGTIVPLGLSLAPLHLLGPMKPCRKLWNPPIIHEPAYPHALSIQALVQTYTRCTVHARSFKIRYIYPK